MRLLVLGGMRFTGRALVEAAHARGHEVTLFNRGTSAAPPAGVEHLRGDRDGGLGVLEGRRWDAAIDTSGYVPRIVRASAEALAGSVAHYTFTSSISVYADHAKPHQNEDAPVATLKDEEVEEISGATYGGLKALCERAAEAAMPGRVAVVRPGLIVWPHDYTDRFPYWVRHMAGDTETLAPGEPSAHVQIIDVRDLAGWMIRLAETKTTGVFNATGPAEPLTFAAFLDALRAALGGRAKITWIDQAFLLERGVVPFNELPLWVPSDAAGFLRTDIGRALAAGLTFRPLAETARDTRAWDTARSDEARATGGGGLTGATMTAARERELLAEWHARTAAQKGA
jgi:2'-hydroxyisoflavone reductase